MAMAMSSGRAFGAGAPRAETAQGTLTRAAGAIAAPVRMLGSALRRHQETQRAISALGRMDDRLLSDIGISRCQILFVAEVGAPAGLDR